ncbi:MAG: hypothetical protein JWQ97_2591 [Phenylobacterium sp.]|nr:hypothetical protein [Phenylobacterium sp.]
MHRLIERAARQARGLGFCVRRAERGWSVWRLSPTGWVWHAQFATRDDAEGYLVAKLVHVDR